MITNSITPSENLNVNITQVGNDISINVIDGTTTTILNTADIIVTDSSGGGTAIPNNITSPSDGQILIYDSASGKWINGNNLNFTNAIFTGSITEDFYSNLTISTSFAIDPTNGTIQKLNLTSSATLTVNLTADGQSVLIEMNSSAAVVTWGTTISWIGGSAPTLTGNDLIAFHRSAGTIIGTYIGNL